MGISADFGDRLIEEMRQNREMLREFFRPDPAPTREMSGEAAQVEASRVNDLDAQIDQACQLQGIHDPVQRMAFKLEATLNGKVPPLLATGQTIEDILEAEMVRKGMDVLARMEAKIHLKRTGKMPVLPIGDRTGLYQAQPVTRWWVDGKPTKEE